MKEATGMTWHDIAIGVFVGLWAPALALFLMLFVASLMFGATFLGF